MEDISCFIVNKKFVNRGFLIGPYCPIYGTGSLLMVILLHGLEDHPVALFFLCILLCSILEYATSYFMEKIFNARWWDYKDKKFNINGRICLETMIPFGIMGTLVVYILNPFFVQKINLIPINIQSIICVILIVIYIIDNVISLKIISSIKLTTKTIKDNTEEITEKVKNILIKKSALTRRLVNAFPKMKMKLKEKFEK